MTEATFASAVGAKVSATVGRITSVAAGTSTIIASCGGKSASFTLTVTAVSSNDVTELDMGDYESQMTVGSTQVLSVTALPTSVTDATITYSSSDTSIATVNSMGRITAVSEGKVKITAACGSIKNSVKITVTKEETVTDIEISDYEDELEVDATMTLTATVIPTTLTEETVSYQSSDTSIATVNSSGEVKGIAPGTVTITVSAGKITKKVKLKVIEATTLIELNEDYLVLNSGDCFQLSASAQPADAPQSMTYTSSDTSVAKVSSGGMVTAVGSGSAAIIVSNGYQSASVSVIVNSDSVKAIESGDTMATDDNITTYDYKIDAGETEVLDEEFLTTLYENGETAVISGEGYQITICGKDISNVKNVFYTDLQINDTDEGTEFTLNRGYYLCGDVTVSLEETEGKYIYLYNESKEVYERVDVGTSDEMVLSSPGTYLITNKKIRKDRMPVLYVAVAVAVLLIGGGVYIWQKKRYWFW